MKVERSSTYQFPKRVIFADGYIVLSAAGTFPEKAGRTKSRNENIMRVNVLFLPFQRT